MPRLRRSDPSRPGIARRRNGSGFVYLDASGGRISDGETVARIRALAIPPAWTDVWISEDPLGHLQAVGTDAAGRRQYRYHDQWRLRRDQQKFDRMLEFARALPGLRGSRPNTSPRAAMTRNRVLACATRLLDRGFFRIGTEAYAEENKTYGLATMRNSHVTLGPDGLVMFEYPAKGSKETELSVVDPAVHEVIATLKRRRGDPDLLAYKAGNRWRDVRSDDINDYIKDVAGDEYSAKDFRTWHGTVKAAVALAVAAPASRSKTAAKRAMAWAVKDVAQLPREHPGRVPGLVHRPARVRPVPVGLDYRGRPRRARHGRPPPPGGPGRHRDRGRRPHPRGHVVRLARTRRLSPGTTLPSAMAASRRSRESPGARRAVPSVDALLRSGPGRKASAEFGRDVVKRAVQEVLAEARRNAGRGHDPLPPDLLMAAAAQRAARASFGLTPVINATGVILHTGLGRAPLPRRRRQGRRARGRGLRRPRGRPGVRPPRDADVTGRVPADRADGRRGGVRREQQRGGARVDARRPRPAQGRAGQPGRAHRDRRGVPAAGHHGRERCPPGRGGHDEPHPDRRLPRRADRSRGNDPQGPSQQLPGGRVHRRRAGRRPRRARTEGRGAVRLRPGLGPAQARSRRDRRRAQRPGGRWPPAPTS